MISTNFFSRIKIIFSFSEIALRRYISILLLIVSCYTTSIAQTIPIGTPAIEDYYRRLQLSGDVDSTVSFTVRPLVPSSISMDKYTADSLVRMGAVLLGSERAKKSLQILPVSWQQRYNTHHPYGWNDGAMIRARGYQSVLSAGVFANYKFISIQLKPEFVFAGNESFKSVKSYVGSMDLPQRYGDGNYSKISWGQSSIRLTFDPVSIGLSNENLWWGPGINNSLLMSNSAPGFKHLTLNTSRPIRTPIGSLEAQIIAGRLEGSGYTATNVPDDWRYLSGVVLSYQPRWVPGLFLGLTRGFQIYSKDMGSGFDDYFPFFQAFQKVNTDEGVKRRDQLTSLFARWLFTKARAEVYFEYGLNDHSYNIRDFLMAPEHSRAYTLGMKKLIPYKGRPDEYIQVAAEITHMEQAIDRIIRGAGNWYSHGQVVHGYTNQGEVLGAGIGPGGNFQSINVSWVSGLKQIGMQLERYEHNGDLANQFGYKSWMDFSVAAVGSWSYQHFVLNTKLQGIHSENYQWQSGANGLPKKDVFNLNAELGIMYRF